jgi:hypothetical protein
MEKTVIDLSNKDLQLNERLYTKFAHDMRSLLFDLYYAGVPVPLTVKGTQQQVDAFMRALKGEKKYMDSYMKHGLGDSRTMMNKRDLDASVRGFEGETGLRWPFKN